jgi:hypothetical protein
LEGIPYQKPKHEIGQTSVGLDLGPSTIAIVPEEGEARLLSFCRELKADKQKKRRLQRKLDRQRRANNPRNYDAKGRVQKGRLRWKESKNYKTTRRRLASQERKLAAHRKSLHGHLVHEIVRTGGILHEIPTRSTRLSQYCHGCGTYVKKKLSERWHCCSCGIGPVQRDLYSAFLACHLDLRTFVPSLAQATWESEGDVRELRLRAAIEDVQKRATAREALPQSFGLSRAGARLPGSLVSDQQELRLRMLEAVARWQEPPAFSAGESQYEQHNME